MSQRIIVLTGVTRGLGAALVPHFVRAGHVVLGCARSADRVAGLRGRFPGPNEFAVVDVADDNAVSLWADRLLKRYGPPDVLINNAALMNEPAPLWAVSAPEFDLLINVNVKGIANMIRHFCPAMIKRGSGVIVNMSSGWGRSTSPEVAPYCCSKWAVEGLTRAFAQELPAGLAAVPLNPGIIDTDMLRQAWSEGAAAFPKAEEWAKKAAPFILALGSKDNGRPLTVS
jgi:NAD(P)-dependent dehydrogenase (short-subunit alcohol dehydrogenase family)